MNERKRYFEAVDSLTMLKCEIDHGLTAHITRAWEQIEKCQDLMQKGLRYEEMEDRVERAIAAQESAERQLRHQTDLHIRYRQKTRETISKLRSELKGG